MSWNWSFITVLAVSLLHTTVSLKCFNGYTAYRRHENSSDPHKRMVFYNSTLDDYNNTAGVQPAASSQSLECSEGDEYCLTFRWENLELIKNKKKWVIWDYRGCYHEAMQVYDTVNLTWITWLQLPDIQERFENDNYKSKWSMQIKLLDSNRGKCSTDGCNTYPEARSPLLPQIAVGVISAAVVAVLLSLFVDDCINGPTWKGGKKVEKGKEVDPVVEEKPAEEPVAEPEPEEESEQAPTETENGVEMQEIEPTVDETTVDETTVDEVPAEVPTVEVPAAEVPVAEVPTDVLAADEDTEEDNVEDNTPLLNPLSSSSPKGSAEDVTNIPETDLSVDVRDATMDDSTYDANESTKLLI